MSQIRSSLSVLTLALSSILPVACASTAPAAPVYTPNFNFGYTAASETTGQDVTIAVVQPVDVDAASAQAEKNMAASGNRRLAAYQSLDTAFKSAMVAQLQELFNKKGFKQRGPFEDLNSMTFPDKKGSDLTLTPQIGIRATVPAAYTHPIDNLKYWFVEQEYETVATGPCTASGFVSFVMLEPLSGEKIWVKKVDVPPIQVDCSGKSAGDQFLLNGYAYVLEQVYQAVMKKAADYLSAEEIVILKKQSQELRAKKVY